MPTCQSIAFLLLSRVQVEAEFTHFTCYNKKFLVWTAPRFGNWIGHRVPLLLFCIMKTQQSAKIKKQNICPEGKERTAISAAILSVSVGWQSNWISYWLNTFTRFWPRPVFALTAGAASPLLCACTERSTEADQLWMGNTAVGTVPGWER